MAGSGLEGVWEEAAVAALLLGAILLGPPAKEINGVMEPVG